VDGFLRGAWQISREQDTATLRIDPYRELSEQDAGVLAQEGRRLLGFAEPDATDYAVQITEADA
jgi:hypothetical protein